MNESEVVKHIEDAVAPSLQRDGYELVLVEYIARQRLVRLYIDRPSGVTIDDCSRVSHLVGDIFDAEGISDRIPGRYHLEVSSPGLDRPLTKPADFQRFVGCQVQIATQEANALGRKRFSGELASADDHGARIVVDGASYDIPYASIARAKLVPDI